MRSGCWAFASVRADIGSGNVESGSGSRWPVTPSAMAAHRDADHQQSDEARRRSHAPGEALLAFRRCRDAGPMWSVLGRFSGHACIRAKSRCIGWWQMKNANPLAVEAVRGRLQPLQASVLYQVMIIRVAIIGIGRRYCGNRRIYPKACTNEWQATECLTDCNSR
jgi:hypothetical protein